MKKSSTLKKSTWSKFYLFAVSASLLLAVSSPVFATERDAEIRQACEKIPSLKQQGAKFYQQKNYTQALKVFKNNAAHTHFCLINQDTVPNQLTDADLATAYNNVGLTYSKLGQYAWAKAWYTLLPKDKKSQYNLSKLPKNLYRNHNVVGEYVNYAGQGAWDMVTVTDQGDHYGVKFYGLRMGLFGLIYGPNLGEFHIKMTKKNGGTNSKASKHHAVYRYEDCQIDLDFSNASLSKQFVQVKQTKGDVSSCGFGYGVYANGVYQKVK